MPDTSIDDPLEGFKDELIKSGKMPKTQESYIGDVKGFIKWLENKEVTFTGELKRLYITSYKKYLIESGYSIATINKKINSLQSFNEYLVGAGYMKDVIVTLGKDGIKTAKGSEDEVEVFSDEEIERILFHIHKREGATVRCKTIVYLLLYTGVRITELVNIKIKDIDFIINNLRVIGKGGKYREIPLKAEVVEVIKEYMEIERTKSKYTDSEYLIVTQRSSKAHRDAILRIVRKMGKELGIKIYPHKFRHTFCSNLLKKGVPLTTVSKLAGHSSIQTTSEYYINTSRKDKMEAVNLL